MVILRLIVNILHDATYTTIILRVLVRDVMEVSVLRFGLAPDVVHHGFSDGLLFGPEPWNAPGVTRLQESNVSRLIGPPSNAHIKKLRFCLLPF